MYTLKDVENLINSSSKCINGQWVPARPIIGSFYERLHDAYKVLTGKYDAIKWPGNQ